ncbi:MAG: YncE family protein, partial [Myxococcaceae bacterium]
MMRTLSFLAVVALAGCGPEDTGKPPPTDRLYFPSGISFAGAPDAGGVLYVANGNSDKRFDFGSVMALDLSRADLPAFGADVLDTGPVAVTGLPIAEGGGGIVNIDSFAGEMAAFPLPGGGTRLFVPSRDERSPLQIIEAQGPRLSCFGAPEGDVDCGASAPSLVANEKTATGLPRANSPFGVGVSADGEVFVTELDAIDSPQGSVSNWHAFVVRVNALDPRVT